MSKQISLTIPEALFSASRKYSKEMGYRSTQEFILDLVRRKVLLDEEERMRRLEEEMDNDPNVKTLRTEKEVMEHFDSL